MPVGAVFGRYWPGVSPLHRMDPRAKLLLSLVLMGIILCVQGFIGLGFCALLTFGLFALARIPFFKALGSIAPLAFVIVIAALLNVFFEQGGLTLIDWGFVQVSTKGLYAAAFSGLRLLLLLLSMSLLTLTTTTLDITDAFESLLAPFARVGLPAHELSMIMGITLRFLPQFMLEVQTIYRAQVSRGAALAKGPFKGGVHMLASLMIPLFTSAFRHAETLSCAMDARCYHGGPGRSRLKALRYGSLDRNATIVLVLALVAVLALNHVETLFA